VKEITLGTEVDGDLLFRSLVAAYMSGAPIIKIRCSEGISAEIREAVRRFTIKAIGQEILEEAEETVITKNLLNPIEMSLESVIRRMAILVRSMVEDSITVLLHESRELGEEVLARDDDLDRLYWLIVRQQNIIARNPAVAEKMSVDRPPHFTSPSSGELLKDPETMHAEWQRAQWLSYQRNWIRRRRVELRTPPSSRLESSEIRSALFLREISREPTG